ncbi:hypothetical protein PG989_005655 [Apiospora arundinis]
MKLSHDTKSGNLHIIFVAFDLSNVTPAACMGIDYMALKATTQGSDETLMEGVPKTYLTQHVPYVDLINGYVLAKSAAPSAAGTAELEDHRNTNELCIHFLRRIVKGVGSMC